MTVCNPPFVHLKNKSRFTASCFVRLTAVFLLPVDLPFLDSDDIIRLIAAYSENQLIISPDARHEGTNAMLLPPLATFTFQYGPHSFAKHLAEAQKQQLQTHILPSPGLLFDLDTLDDWVAYQQQVAATILWEGKRPFPLHFPH